MHTIWLAINAFRFQSKIQSLHSTKVRIRSLIAMSDNASTGKCLNFDSALLDDFAVPHHRKFKEIVLVL